MIFFKINFFEKFFHGYHEPVSFDAGVNCLQGYQQMTLVDRSLSRFTTSSGNHGKPGKSFKKVPCMEKSWNLKKP